MDVQVTTGHGANRHKSVLSIKSCLIVGKSLTSNISQLSMDTCLHSNDVDQPKHGQTTIPQPSAKCLRMVNDEVKMKTMIIEKLKREN